MAIVYLKCKALFPTGKSPWAAVIRKSASKTTRPCGSHYTGYSVWTYNNVASRVHRGNKEDIEHEKSNGQIEVNIQEGAVLIQNTPA